jgi:hypothetical protein
MTKKPIDVSAVTGLVLIVTDPFAGTALLILAVASFVLIIGITNEAVDTCEFVITITLSPAAIFTVPEILLIVLAPVVSAAVLVEGTIIRSPKLFHVLPLYTSKDLIVLLNNVVPV